MKEAMANNQARGSYSLFFMLCLALRFSHRLFNLFLAFDPSLSRLSRSFIIIASLFLSLAITGLYCKVAADNVKGVIIALIVSKALLIILNLLMVKRPKVKRIKTGDKDFELNRPDATKKESNEPKFKEVISYKLTPNDKMSFSIGYFIIFAIIGGSIFFSLTYSRKVNSRDNLQWLTMYIILMILDFGIFEFVAIFISTIILK
jgi:hypothetical protein